MIDRHRIVSVSLLGLALLGGIACMQTPASQCDDGRLCPADRACDNVHRGCVLPEQLLCAGQPQGTMCSYPGEPNGACFDGVCFPAGCGNGELEDGEACDDGNNDNGDGCNADCSSNETCGNGHTDTRTESCDDGKHCQSVCAISGMPCTSDLDCADEDTCNLGSSCDGDVECVGIGDGQCKPRDGDGCQADCSSPTCGDGVVDREFNEECDAGDNNSNSPDAPCRPNCLFSRCGDGIQDSDEVCDDGDTTSGNGCRFDCLSDEVCGNGELDSAAGELCDDGKHCESVCDDGASCIVDGDCVGVGTGACTPGNFCNGDADCLGVGDGLCKTRDSDGCQADCLTPSCGDGIVDPQFNEECDCGKDPFNLPRNCATVNSDLPDATCRNNCRSQTCGDQIVDLEAGEECDNEDPLPGDGCSGTCRLEVCGNGVVDVVQLEGGSGFAPAEECDDGANNLNHDGCATGCSLEQPVWTEVLPRSPLPRNQHAIAYDAARGRVVVFGGEPLNGETWEWDGENWTDVTQGDSPSPRVLAAMAYDGARQQVVLFGGIDGQRRGDTWIWDGSSWTEVTPKDPSQSPSPRTSHAVAYDAARKQVVLFGGFDGDTPLEDTWVWDGASWREVTPQSQDSSPPGLLAHAMTYDPVRGRVVLFGGFHEFFVPLGDTWEWDGSVWKRVIDEASPSAAPKRFSHHMAFDAARNETVLFGGANETTPALADTWVLSSTGWRDATPEDPLDSAPGRRSHGMAYDVLRSEVVMFGGIDSSNSSRAETWRWQGTRWSEATPNTATAPPSNAFHSVSVDTARARAVLFGGLGASTDTWEWDGAAWRDVTPLLEGDSPPGRSLHATAYDETRGLVVLFGGQDADRNDLGDTWVWDGVKWLDATPSGTNQSPSLQSEHAMAYDASRERVVLFAVDRSTWEWDGVAWENVTPVDPTMSPGIRRAHALAYDRIRQRVVLFGGENAQGPLADTWEWNGDVWVERLPSTAPPARQRHAMAYDSRRGRVTLFGGLGLDQLNDLWEWDGSTWVKVPLASLNERPSVRNSSGVAYDGMRGQLLLFGGFEPDLGIFGDTWIFQFSSGTDESCTTGFDGDADGLVGCEDPDCWGRCTPQCPANSTLRWPSDCDTTQPHCGDGVCNSFLETPRLCPSDCGAPTPICGDFHCDALEGVTSCPGDCTP